MKIKSIKVNRFYGTSKPYTDTVTIYAASPNPRFFQGFGYSPMEAMGKAINRLVDYITKQARTQPAGLRSTKMMQLRDWLSKSEDYLFMALDEVDEDMPELIHTLNVILDQLSDIVEKIDKGEL